MADTLVANLADEAMRERVALSLALEFHLVN
jgi:hypothetical protein